MTRRKLSGSAPKETPELEVLPVTRERFSDLERLFGPRGACGGCWCMWWRLTAREFDAMKGEENRAALAALVDRGEVPGLLAYSGSEPVGWCSVAPRETFPRLERSRLLRRVDDEPVWSIVCFYVARAERGRGVMTALVRGAIDTCSPREGGSSRPTPWSRRRSGRRPSSSSRGLLGPSSPPGSEKWRGGRRTDPSCGT